jgi:hypothetical protein
MQRWLSVLKLSDITHQFSRIKGKNNMFISLDAEKAFDKIQHDKNP